MKADRIEFAGVIVIHRPGVQRLASGQPRQSSGPRPTNNKEE